MPADLTMSPTRVRLTTDAIYSPARRCQKRRRCDGHLAERHWIEVGDPIYWSALPPNSEIGNTGWWHSAFCQDCAPVTEGGE